MTFVGTPRPPRRWHHASTTVDDFAVVTFVVDPERVRRQVHEPFVPTEWTFADGSVGCLVSVVAFVERDFAFRFAPVVRVSGALVDYRAYGRVGGEHGVYVFRTSLDHPFVVVPRVLWRMPWRREPVRIDSRWDGPGPPSLRVSTDGAAGLSMDLRAIGPDVGPIDGFVDGDEAVRVLTHPMAGWYASAGGLHRYSVWHDVLEPLAATATDVRVPFLRSLDVLDEDAPVHSALMVRHAAFDVHTPPRRVG